MSSKEKMHKYTSIQEAIYSRSKRELHHPSSKIIGKKWTNEHVSTFKQFWNILHENIMDEEINSFKDASGSFSCNLISTQKEQVSTRTRLRSKTAPNRSAAAVVNVADHSKSVFEFSAKLIRDICTSMEFGNMLMQNIRNDKKAFESDIITFWFCTTFNTTHNKRDFLYFRYIKDQMTKKKKSCNRIQITCDIEYAQKNHIINSKENILPKNALIEIFKYVEPTKLLALYTYDVDIDTDAFDLKHFHMSNIRWVCNYYGLEAVFMCKLFKILLVFLDSEQVEDYVEKTKIYHKNWKEWKDAQMDLNMMQVHNVMQQSKRVPKRKI